MGSQTCSEFSVLALFVANFYQIVAAFDNFATFSLIEILLKFHFFRKFSGSLINSYTGLEMERKFLDHVKVN
jgi:hypothetical protein